MAEKYPDNQTSGGDVDLEAEKAVSCVIDVLKNVTEAAQGLATSLPSMKVVLYRIEKEQEEMEDLAARQTEEVDLLVQVELSRLKLEFQSCTTKAKLFVYACVTMAKYGHSREIAKIIDNELESGSISSLKEFIKDILTQTQVVVGQRKVAATGLQCASAVGIGTGVLLQNMGLLSPKMSALAIGGGIFSFAVSSALKKYLSEVDNGRPTIIQGAYAAQRKIFEDAQKCISELAKSMDKVTHQITEIEAHTKQAKDDIDGVNENCLESHEGEKLTRYLKQAIKEHLRNFREALQDILDITGPDGARISSEPDEFLRTNPEQPSEDKEAPVSERNPMTIKFTGSSPRKIDHSLDVKIPEKLSALRISVPAEDSGGLHTQIETGMNLAVTHTTDADEQESEYQQ